MPSRRELDLVVVRPQVDEQLVDVLEHLCGAAVVPVDLVDDHDDLEPGVQRLLQHEAGLGQGPLRGIHQEYGPVGHGDGSLHLAAEVGMTGSVDDVDLHPAPVQGAVLGRDGDALLPLELHGV
jgi:hypothetical protein